MFGYKLIKKQDYASEYKKAIKQIREENIEYFERKYRKEIDDLKNIITAQEIDLHDWERKYDKAENEREALESDRDDARELAALEMKLADKSNELDARKEILDEKQSRLKEREANLDSKEEANYKNGYADGVADGLREISEITQKDRDNAMKVAMVAAASHTPTANLKEINNVHQLSAGDTDKEG